MKKLIFLLIASAFSAIASVHAQCAKDASGFGNNDSNTSYHVKGGVKVTLNVAKTSFILSFASNFDTAAGPDVKVYLVNPGSMSTAALKSFNPASDTANSIFIGDVSTSYSNPDGAKTFNATAIPSGRNINQYTKVFFHCVCAPSNSLWDFGTIESFSTCSQLSLDESSYDSFKVTPNPARESLTINLDQFSSDLKVNVYNTLGTLVYSKENLGVNNNKLDIAHFSKGVYVLEVSDNENKTLVKRFIKE